MKLKTVITYLFLGALIFSCKEDNASDKDSKEKNEKEISVNEKAKQKNEKEIVLNENAKDKTEIDSKQSELDSLKAIYSHVRAKYESFEMGDLAHHMFLSEKGEAIDFLMIKDYTYELVAYTDEEGETANPKFVGKTFDIFYKVEQHDLMDWGEKSDVDVVYKLMLLD